MKKITLGFDATILANAAHKNAGRSGIYFTAYNIAKILHKNKNVNLLFYCDRRAVNSLHYAINTCLTEFKDVPVLFFETHKTWFDKQIAYMYQLKTFAKTSNCKGLAVLFHYIGLFEKILFFVPNLFLQKKNSNRFIDCVVSIKNISKESGHKIMAFVFHYIALLLKVICFVPGIIASLFTKHKKNPDVFFSPCFVVPDSIACNKKIKKFTLIHDVIPFILPEYFESAKKNSNGEYWLERLVRHMSTNNTDKYFANSLCTKNDFLKLVPSLNKNQITVTYLACAESFHPCSHQETLKALQKYKLPTNKKYVFSLCSLEPRKNLIRAVKTFIKFIEKNKIDDMVFVLGGGHWDEFIGKIESEIKNLGKYKNKIIRAGYIEDLAPLYSGAAWFVYTSQYEGFGLPTLEAMACGCPVITSNNSCLPEVVGDTAIKIDYDSDAQHIAAYEKYYFNEKYRKKMADAGLKRSKQFSWDKTVKQMLEDME